MGYFHPHDARPQLVVGSLQRWRPDNARVSLFGAEARRPVPFLVVGAEDPGPVGRALARISTLPPTKALGVGLVIGALLGVVGYHYSRE